MNRISIRDGDDLLALSHGIMNEVVPHEASAELTLRVQLPVGEVQTQVSPPDSWRYAYVELELKFSGVSSIRNSEFASGQDAPIEAWRNEDILVFELRAEHCWVDSLLFRLEFSFEKMLIQ